MCCKAPDRSNKRDTDDGEWMEPICGTSTSPIPDRDGPGKDNSIDNRMRSKKSVVKWTDLARENISSTDIDGLDLIDDINRGDEELYNAVNSEDPNNENSVGRLISMGSIFSEDSVSRGLGGFSKTKRFTLSETSLCSEGSMRFSDLTMAPPTTEEFDYEDGDSDTSIRSGESNSNSGEEKKILFNALV